MQPLPPKRGPAGPPHASSASRRTRRAILDAAATTLSRDARASLGDIAHEAGVGRTTLHRHFPDRRSLVRALARDADEQASAAIARSRIDDGPVVPAIERLLYELLALGDRFTFLLREPDLADDAGVRSSEERTSRAVSAMIARGQASGELRADLRPDWIAEAAGMLVYAAWSALESGALERADAHRVVVATLLDGVRAG